MTLSKIALAAAGLVAAGSLSRAPRALAEEPLAPRHRVELPAGLSTLPVEEIRRLAEEVVIADAALRGERAIVEHKGRLADAEIPAGADGAAWLLPNRAGLRGSLLLTLAFTRGSELLGRVPVSVRVRTFGPVVVTSQTIDRLALLTADDLVLEERETTLAGPVVQDLSQAVGYRARRSLFRGEMLRPAHLSTPPLVRKGQQVEVVYDSGDLRVRMLVEAREDGWAGDRIRVRQVGGRDELVARVAEDGTLRVDG